ncbi:alpha/beta hydrolase [Streptomyces sp. SAJ15]|uniref:alpha/beta hydrolase family protein n=1 Tax=Streptomyces sp. SAJ15 TaxID=2011095 RepID=UPI0021B2C4D7|nr:alpha/beta hydrolase [Streptomyces sp. SAJ15]
MTTSLTSGAATMGRRTVAKSAALAAATLLTGGGTAWARSSACDPGSTSRGGLVLRLPAPTGPHRVGVTSLHLVDGSRTDPWDDRITVRELMVSVFYPARSVRGRRRAPQLTPEAAVLFGQIDVHAHQPLPDAGVDWAATLTHAYENAPARPVRRPVLLYSPGGGDPRTVGTTLAEELASHGHVVVTMDHPGDSSEVEFPAATAERAKVRATVLFGPPTPARFRTMVDTRLADTAFVLDRLADLAAGRNPDAEGRPLPQGLPRALDLRRVGVYGHSAGGTTAAQALYDDPRIGAAVDLEGYLDHPAEAPGQPGELFPVARNGVDRPLLLLGTDGFRDERFDRSWSAMLAHPGGHTRLRRVDDATHWVFTDYAAMVPRLQAAGLMTAEERRSMIGAIAPARAIPAVRNQVRGFFARHLPPAR